MRLGGVVALVRFLRCAALAACKTLESCALWERLPKLLYLCPRGLREALGTRFSLYVQLETNIRAKANKLSTESKLSG